PDVWNEPERAQALGKERSSLEAVVDTLDQMKQGLEDVSGLLELAVQADDEETFNEAISEPASLEKKNGAPGVPPEDSGEKRKGRTSRPKEGGGGGGGGWG
ncbi:PCRF domain-containing protein, partial [Escherichia coli]|uniref:PCRF domain-containing protein n=1 Tax=Escherichia coli TaxID=562 RepID=UPI0010CB39A2